jgi:hypothetical protein
LVALFLAMGIASPLWMRAIDGFGAPAAIRCSPSTTAAEQPSPQPAPSEVRIASNASQGGAR